MKKTPICSAVALALATSAPAFAASQGELKELMGNASFEFDIGGYVNFGAAFTKMDFEDDFGDRNGGNEIHDAEIHFRPKLVLENGLTIGANIQLEGQSSGDQIDEAYAYVEGSFGKVVVGDENSAGYELALIAPDVSLLGYDGEGNPPTSTSNLALGLLPVSGATQGSDFYRGTLGSTRIENARKNDPGSFSYYTPDINGLVVGVTYSRDSFQDSAFIADCDNTTCDFIDVGARWNVQAGEASIALSGRWGTAKTPGGAPKPSIFGGGLHVGVGPLKVGGSWAKQKNSGNDEGDAFDAGVAFMPPGHDWSYSLTYFSGNNLDDENFAGTGSKEKAKFYSVAARRDFNKYFSLSPFVVYVDFDEATGPGGTGVGQDATGFAAGLNLLLRF